MTATEQSVSPCAQYRQFKVTGKRTLSGAMRAKGIPKIGEKLWKRKGSPSINFVSASEFDGYFIVVVGHQSQMSK